ncbi:unnamed protein product [Caenorhabditis bovis]|uniref:Uncharacterized protein n=1 Tax=Caenorhabditis bovis TaxID=2654633 RepID=A0A8S1EDJ4_9PELO|nr:unnamed protein product [Caenorhabditis bovis]
MSGTSSNSAGSVVPTARSPSIVTAYSHTDTDKTALSKSANTAIGATDSELHGRVGMTDTSAGSYRGNSKSDETSTALSPKSPDIILSNLRRGAVFGTSNRGNSSQPPEPNANSITYVTFSNNNSTVTGSQISEPESSKQSVSSKLSEARLSRVQKLTQGVDSQAKAVEKQRMAEKLKKKQEEIRRRREKEAQERNEKIRAQNLREISDLSTGKSKMSSASQKSKAPPKLRLRDSVAQSARSGRSMSTARSKFTSSNNSESPSSAKSVKKSQKTTHRKTTKKPARSARRKPKESDSSESGTESTEGSAKSLKTAKMSDNSERSCKNSPNALVKQNVEGQMKKLADDQKRAVEQSAKSKKPMMSRPTSYVFPGAGRTTMSMVTTAQASGGLKAPPPPPAHQVYDVSKLSNSQRGFTPAPNQSNKPRSLFGNGNARPIAARPAPPPSASNVSMRQHASSGGNKVVLYGTTPDGKNQVEFSIFMRIVSGEALGPSNAPVDLVPKKVIIGGKEISVDMTTSEPKKKIEKEMQI